MQKQKDSFRTGSENQFVRYGSVILLIFCIFCILWWAFPSLCSIWDHQVEDRIMRFTYSLQGPRPANPYIVHIDLDDQSVASLPYDKNDPRLYTELIRILTEAGVKTVLVDMVFPYCRPGRETLCASFAKEIEKAGNVYFPVILSKDSLPDNQTMAAPSSLTNELAIWNINGVKNFDLLQGEIILANLAEINMAAAGLGHINFPPDRDGVYRRLPVFINTSKGAIPSLALRTISGYLNVTPEQIRISDGKTIQLTNVRFPDGRKGDISIPVDRHARNRISFSGIWNDSFHHYSFATIINTGATPDGLMDLTDELEDSLAIVSDVSTGSRDYGPIPLSSYFPLSGLHSNLINSIMEKDFIHAAGFSSQLLLDGGLILLLTLAAVYLRGFPFSLCAVALFGAILAGDIYLFMDQRLIVPLIRPSLSVITAAPVILLLQFFDVQQKEQYIRGQLTHYFAPSLMEKILDEPELLENVEKKELTILFSDIVGFTSWSSTKEAQEIHETLNHYFEEMAAIVFAHQGTIDKYMGDGLMVFFGDPVPCENHSLLAVQAAIAMQKKTRELRAEWERVGGMPIAIRIGVHTGEVVVGNMGSKSRVEYTVIGSNVNLAQRLESNCPPGGIMLSKEVENKLNGLIDVESAGTIHAKGFSQPISVCTVRGLE